MNRIPRDNSPAPDVVGNALLEHERTGPCPECGELAKWVLTARYVWRLARSGHARDCTWWSSLGRASTSDGAR